ncbi:MAG: hypothetical protein JNM94_00005, partial [Phycisphaerae bacterium]|nr:hypothetical protein [Phycisphaerae bacterium]
RRPSHFPHTPYKEEPLREPFREPPPQPPVDDASLAEGGGGDAIRKAAERIVDAYPPTTNDVRELDVRAAIDAIEHERRLVGRGDGLITAEDIVAATMAFALKAPDTPLWCRTWLSKRGYHAFVRRERAKVAKAIEAARRREGATASGPAADHESVKAERATTDAALAGLAAHELEELKRRVLDAEPNEFARSLLMRSDPRRSPILRERMAAVRRSIAPEIAPEFAAAG